VRLGRCRVKRRFFDLSAGDEFGRFLDDTARTEPSVLGVHRDCGLGSFTLAGLEPDPSGAATGDLRGFWSRLVTGEYWCNSSKRSSLTMRALLDVGRR
jgi:hypothetical protein